MQHKTLDKSLAEKIFLKGNGKVFYSFSDNAEKMGEQQIVFPSNQSALKQAQDSNYFVPSEVKVKTFVDNAFEKPLLLINGIPNFGLKEASEIETLKNLPEEQQIDIIRVLIARCLEGKPISKLNQVYTSDASSDSEKKEILPLTLEEKVNADAIIYKSSIHHFLKDTTRDWKINGFATLGLTNGHDIQFLKSYGEDHLDLVRILVARCLGILPGGPIKNLADIKKEENQLSIEQIAIIDNLMHAHNQSNSYLSKTLVDFSFEQPSCSIEAIDGLVNIRYIDGRIFITAEKSTYVIRSREGNAAIKVGMLEYPVKIACELTTAKNAPGFELLGVQTQVPHLENVLTTANPSIKTYEEFKTEFCTLRNKIKGSILSIDKNTNTDAENTALKEIFKKHPLNEILMLDEKNIPDNKLEAIAILLDELSVLLEGGIEIEKIEKFRIFYQTSPLKNKKLNDFVSELTNNLEEYYYKKQDIDFDNRVQPRIEKQEFGGSFRKKYSTLSSVQSKKLKKRNDSFRSFKEKEISLQNMPPKYKAFFPGANTATQEAFRYIYSQLVVKNLKQKDDVFNKLNAIYNIDNEMTSKLLDEKTLKKLELDKNNLKKEINDIIDKSKIAEQEKGPIKDDIKNFIDVFELSNQVNFLYQFRAETHQIFSTDVPSVEAMMKLDKITKSSSFILQEDEKVDFNQEFSDPYFDKPEKIKKIIEGLKNFAPRPIVSKFLSDPTNLNQLLGNIESQLNIFFQTSINDGWHVEIARELNTIRRGIQKETPTEEQKTKIKPWLRETLKIAVDELFDNDGNLKPDIYFIFNTLSPDLANNPNFKNILLLNYIKKLGNINRNTDLETIMLNEIINNNTIINAEFINRVKNETIIYRHEINGKDIKDDNNNYLKNLAKTIPDKTKQYVIEKLPRPLTGLVSQFLNDYINRPLMRVNGKTHLGLPPEQRNITVDDFFDPNDKEQKTLIIPALIKQKFSELGINSDDVIKTIITTHSQDLSHFMHQTVWVACDNNFEFKNPTDFVEHNVYERNGKLYISVSGPGLYIMGDASSNKEFKGFFNAPYSLTYEINPETEECIIDKIETNNEDLKRIFNGEKIPSQEMQKYCTPMYELIAEWYDLQARAQNQALLYPDVRHALINFDPYQINDPSLINSYLNIIKEMKEVVRNPEEIEKPMDIIFNELENLGKANPFYEQFNTFLRSVPRIQIQHILLSIDERLSLAKNNDPMLAAILKDLLEKKQKDPKPITKEVIDILKNVRKITTATSYSFADLSSTLNIQITKRDRDMYGSTLINLYQYYRLHVINDLAQQVIRKNKPKTSSTPTEKNSWAHFTIHVALDNLFDEKGELKEELKDIVNLSGIDVSTPEGKWQLVLYHVRTHMLYETIGNADFYIDMLKKSIDPNPVINEKFIKTIHEKVRDDLESVDEKPFTNFETERYEYLLSEAINSVAVESEALQTIASESNNGIAPEVLPHLQTLSKLGQAQLEENPNLINKAVSREEKLLVLDHNNAVGKVLRDKTSDSYDKCMETSKKLYKKSDTQKAAGIGFAILGTILLIASIACLLSLKFAPIGVLGLKVSIGVLGTAAAILGIGALSKSAYSWHKFFIQQGPVTKEVGKSVEFLESKAKKNSP